MTTTRVELVEKLLRADGQDLTSALYPSGPMPAVAVEFAGGERINGLVFLAVVCFGGPSEHPSAHADLESHVEDVMTVLEISERVQIIAIGGAEEFTNETWSAGGGLLSARIEVLVT